MIKIFIPEPVKLILNRLKENGYPAVIAGGAVRDGFLGSPSSDVDIVTQAENNQIEALFPDYRVKKVGQTFPVCLIKHVEVAPARKGALNSKSNRSYHWIETDLGYRDLTVNAMAWDPETETLFDPFDGQKDLNDKIIRFTLDPELRIVEDPARMVRACRFLAMLSGRFEHKTLIAIRELKDRYFKDVAKERIRVEIVKAMSLNRPSLFFKALQETGLLVKIFPSLARCVDLDGGPYHGETVFEHCMLVGDALPAGKPLLRLAGFLHDTGKYDAATLNDGRVTFAGHEQNYHAVEKDLGQLRFSSHEIDYMVSLTRAHMRPLNDQTTPRAARRLLTMLEKFNLDYRDFMRLRISDKKGNLKKRPYTLDELKIRLGKLYREMNSDAVLTINQLKISGDDIIRLLNLEQGPRVGKIKQLLFEKVLDNPDLNTYEDLKKLCLSLKTEK